MKTSILALLLLLLSFPAFADRGPIRRCEAQLRKTLEQITGLPNIAMNNCRKDGALAICTGWANGRDDQEIIDFVFGAKANCKLAFYRETTDQ